MGTGTEHRGRVAKRGIGEMTGDAGVGVDVAGVEAHDVEVNTVRVILLTLTEM